MVHKNESSVFHYFCRPLVKCADDGKKRIGESVDVATMLGPGLGIE